MAFCLLVAACDAHAAPGQATAFPIPTETAEPTGITPGPDGSLWFTEFRAGKIGRISTTGETTEYSLPSPGDHPGDIAAGPDGALWFTESGAGAIGRITTAGQITEFLLPDARSTPSSITDGPDGALWFTDSGEEDGAGAIGRITTAGQVTEFPLPGSGEAHQIALGPGGELWFTASGGPSGGGGAGEIGRISTLGRITEIPLPRPPGEARSGSRRVGTGEPLGITAGPEGDVWFTLSVQTLGLGGGETLNEEGSEGLIGRVTPEGRFSEFPIPSGDGNYPQAIVPGPDGHFWFTSPSGTRNWGYRGGKIDAISPSGHVTGFPSGWNGTVSDLAVGSDSDLWYTASTGCGIREGGGCLSAIVSFSAGLTEADVSTARPVAVGRWTKLGLSCASPGVECRGEVRLHDALGTVAKRRFRLASGLTHKFALRLSRKAQNYLARERWMNVTATVQLAEGVAETREILLRRRHESPAGKAERIPR